MTADEQAFYHIFTDECLEHFFKAREDSEYFKKGTVVVLEKGEELSASFADGEKVQFGCNHILESDPPIVPPLWIRKAGSFSYSLEQAKAAVEQAGFVLDQ